MKTYFALILLGFFSVALPAREIIIDPDHAVISATTANDPAAQELKTHLELITGKKIPVLGGGQVRRNAFIFHIGKAPAGAPEKFQPEEARWEITPDAAYFYGEGAKGSLYAVYDFLENELGVRWPGGSDIAFRKQNPIRVKNPEGKWIPKLNMRGIRVSSTGGRKAREAASLWRRRLRTGGHDRPSYGHAFTQYWKRFGKTHPEYFAMRKDGVRAPVGAKADADNAAAFRGAKAQAIALCVSNEALVDQVIADWREKSCPLYINLCENDALGKDSCHCPKCTALDVVPKKKTPWENWYADRYVNFANRVLARARKIRPDVKAAMYAYNAAEQAPKREKPDASLVIGMVPTDFTMAGIEAYVGAWKNAGLNHFFYRPNRHTYYSLPQLPVGYEKHFFDLWQYLYRSGAIGFDYDSQTETGCFQYFDTYVLLKAMQDPSKTFAHWEKHYMQAFGAAADDIREYYRYWREQVWEKRLAPDQAKIAERGKWFNFARGLVWSLGKYYKESDFIEAGKYLDAALLRDLTAEERVRIEKMKLANEHARLFYNAVVNKKDADSLKLLAFREKHGFTLLPANEKHYGDICGIQRVMNFKDYLPPYLKMPLFWNFRLDPDNKGLEEKWYENTPAQVRRWGAVMCTNTPWESPHKHYRQISAAIRAKTANYDGIAWYGTQITIPADWKDRKVFLYFGAVDESCRLYVNGKKAGERIFKKSTDWSTPFAIEITSFIDWKQKQQNVIVRVEDKSGQGGIWKPVWLVSKQI